MGLILDTSILIADERGKFDMAGDGKTRCGGAGGAGFLKRETNGGGVR